MFPRIPQTLSLLTLLTLALSPLADAQEITRKKFLQHMEVLGSDECIECHESEIKAWQQTKHYFNKDLHTSDKALEIARKMGITSAAQIRTSSLCVQCHFTVQKQGTAPAKVISGVSCESCHGGARNWLEVHNTGDRREADDTPADQAARVAKAKAAGMLYPEDYHLVAENCYSCHIITDEKLVNVGGHPAGSSDFELVAWLGGEVRHNFFHSKGETNDPTPIERKRMLYIAGTALDLEYSLLGLARAVEKGDYGNFMGRSCQAARTRLNSIVEALGSEAPESLTTMATAVNQPGLLKFFNVEPLEAAAGQVGEALKDFSKNNDGSNFGAIDSMLTGEVQGDVYQP